MITFQEIFLKLEEFWSKQGCLIQQPYDIEVGAGTMNPATFLRVLGPEPWNVAYVEPSRRPTDGRYGENPNRLQHYYQYQVILKPSPSDVQELYLKSLDFLGIKTSNHDIRFVEDDWESPNLGAWGLGWEVWLDGKEVTQFTYFQQAGGLELDDISAEITYGIERIAMYLQGVDSVFDLVWVDSNNRKITYHDSCYLGRGNKIYEAPRNVIKTITNNLSEMSRSKENGLCCGAGGSQIFKESESGKAEINIERIKDIQKVISLIKAIKLHNESTTTE